MESGSSNQANRQALMPNTISSSTPSNSQINNPNARQKHKKWSKVWEHFTAIINELGEEKGKCNYCSKLLSAATGKHGTSGMTRHLNICPQFPKSKGCGQTELQGGGEYDDGEVKPLGFWKFNQEAVRKGLAYMIIVDELPFKFVEGRGFKHFMSIACPHFHIPSRWTITRDCFQFYLDEKLKLKKLIKNSHGRICLTTDTWTSIQRINYLCLTAHFIDDDWKLHKRVINFCPISSHKGEDIGKVIEKCLLDWQVDNVFTITVDNASSNDTAITYLKRKFVNWGKSIMGGKFLHVRCLAHIINLVVQDGLRECNKSIESVRGAVRYVRQSPARLKKFKECVEIEKIESKKMLSLDVPTRWNSTYMMLATAKKFERAFERFEEQDPFFKIDLEAVSGVPTQEDWENVSRLSTFLEHFYDFTLKVSGTSYVTCNELLDEITDVDATLKEWMLSDDMETRDMALRMKQKYDKYWGNIEKMNLLLFVAYILDPRNKFDEMEYSLSRMYGHEGGSRMCSLIKATTYDLYNEYKSLNSPPLSSLSTTSNEVLACSSESDEVPRKKKTKIYKQDYKQLKAGEGGSNAKNELDKFLAEDVEIENLEGKDFDILMWWKVNSHRFPILSIMARDILAIPFSTIASESAFSTGGRVLDAFRSSLTPRLVQALICAQDWVRSSMQPINVEENLEDLEKFENDLLKSSVDSTIIDV